MSVDLILEGEIEMPKQLKDKKNIYIIIAIFVLSVNMRPAITSIGPMLETIRQQLTLSNAQVSLLTAVPVICMGVFATMAPVLKRKFGLKRTIYSMIIIIGLMTGLRGFISGFPVLILTAFFIGIAIAIIGPLLSAMIKQYFPERAASVIGIYSFGMGVGSAASAGLTTVFFESSGSYPLSLSIWSILAILGIAAWYLATKEDMKVLQPAQQTAQLVIEKMKSPWRIRKAWLFLLFFGLQSSAFFSIITWLAPLAISAGMTLLQAGMLLTIMTTVQIFLNIIIPLLMQKFPARKFWLLLMLTAGVIALCLLWTGIHPLMFAGAFVMGIPLGGLFPVALLLPLDETDTVEETNSWTAMMQTGGFIIGGLLPLLIAIVYDGTANHNYTYVIILSLYVLMFLLAFMIGDKKAPTQ